MKKIASYLIIISCVFWQSSFATSSSDTSKETQDSKQKMAQLQQLLMRAAQTGGDTGAAANNLGGKSAAESDKGNFLAERSNIQKSSTASSGVTALSLPQNNDASTAVPKSTSNPYDEAFAGVVSQMLPMTPDQIAKLRSVFSQSQLAAATPPGIPPKPTSTSMVVNLAPQATPPVIRLGAGYITSLVFVDSTGQPWPIKAYSIGDPSAFNIQWDHKGNTLLVQSSTLYKRSNLAVMLTDLNTPVMITLLSGQGAVDYRVDLHIPKMGPNAVFVQEGMPDAANPLLLDVLSAIPPSGSKALKVSGGNAQAWLLGNRLYLRTNNLNVISPAWQATMRSADGTNAYQLPLSPVILTTQNGSDKVITLRIEGD